MKTLEEAVVHLEEDELFDNFSKKTFYTWLELNGYDNDKLKFLFDLKKVDTTEQNKFNNILKRAKIELGIPIHNMVLYFEDDLIRLKKILNIIDNSVNDIIKNELSVKHKIKIDKSSIYQLIY